MKKSNAGQGINDDVLSLKFSHNIIEHLGLKLYQNKPTNVLAELVSNSWDANAANVWIGIKNSETGSPVNISVSDNGSGMSLEVLKKCYLVVGKTKDGSGVDSVRAARPPMGRKGIGKLAPFGVAKELHVVTVSDNKIIWLIFDYAQMLSQSAADNGELSNYQPKVLVLNETKNDFDAKKYSSENDVVESVNEFLNQIDECGTLILARKLTLKKVISPKTLTESLARRFTVFLCNPDFKVSVNGAEIIEEQAFPKWELRIPNEGWLDESFTVTLGDGQKSVRNIRFWVGFVKEASWPVEQSGVGVYAHGKIAQDRPFFFEVKGLEISTRYLYAQIEADWIDELDEDVISTDRTSIDWDNDAFNEFKEWGSQKIKDWVKVYRKHQADNVNEENEGYIKDVVSANPRLKLRDTEEKHLLALLNEVTPKLSKEDDQRNRFVEATMKAWLHDPARKLIKQLWEKSVKDDANGFFDTVSKLVEQLVPESLSIATVFAQRVFALSRLNERINFGKETDLQKLIEQFPWILNNKYEKYVYRTSLNNVCKEAEKQGLLRNRVVSTGGGTFPDFVFFESQDKNILVVELKSPSESADTGEWEQLDSYVRFLQSKHTDTDVKGLLVAKSFAEVLSKDAYSGRGIEKKSWDTILKESRRGHMDLLAALISNNSGDPNRVANPDIAGNEVQDFLIEMAKHDEDLKYLMSTVNPQPLTT